VLLAMSFLDVAKFTTLTPLSLLILCKLSSPIVGLKMSSQPTLVLKFPNNIFMWYLGNLSNKIMQTANQILKLLSLDFGLCQFVFLGFPLELLTGCPLIVPSEAGKCYI
jgi:hypothetical protein